MNGGELTYRQWAPLLEALAAFFIVNTRAAVKAEADIIRAELNLRRPHPTVREAAEELGTSDRTVRRMLCTGRLRRLRIGGRVRVDRASLDSLLGIGRPA